MTIEMTLGQVAEQVFRQSESMGGAGQPLGAAPDDVALFEDAMGQTSGTRTLPVDDLPFDGGLIDPADFSGPFEGVGDAILRGMEKMRGAHEANVERVNETISKASLEPMTVQDTIKLQFDLMQLNIQQDVTTKIADKSSQGVQTLFKNQ